MKHEINDTVLVPMKVVRILDSEDGKVLQLGAAFCNETKSYAVDILESELDPSIDGEMSNKDAAEIIKIARAEVEWEFPIEYAVAFGMAIEALERESCEDAVSRVEVLDLMQLRMSGKELYKAVYEMPSVVPKSDWIPVSEN